MGMYKKWILKDVIDFDVSFNTENMLVLKKKVIQSDVFFVLNLLTLDDEKYVEFTDIENPDLLFRKWPTCLRFQFQKEDYFGVLFEDQILKIYEIVDSIFYLRSNIWLYGSGVPISINWLNNFTFLIQNSEWNLRMYVTETFQNLKELKSIQEYQLGKLTNSSWVTMNSTYMITESNLVFNIIDFVT